VITAIVFVRTELGSVNEVAEALAALPSVSEVYSVTGKVDLIALLRVRTNEAVAATVTDAVAHIPGIHSTETHIAFRSYSRHDLEAAFSVGLDS